MSTPEHPIDLTAVVRDRRSPLASQVAAAQTLACAGRLLARLPTGAGKTRLAALPFAAGVLRARQMVFMTPLRTLASAQARALAAIDEEPASHALGRPWLVREQTGAVPDDPLFTAPAVVCTFDQALSSALQISYSTSARRRTVNAGAILSSYLVADELHLYPRREALTTLLWLLKHRPPELPFTLMTATLSAPMCTHLATLLDAAYLGELPPADITRLGLTNRRRTVHWQEQPLHPAQIAALAGEHARVLIVVNTVDRAITLGRALRAIVDCPVWILHSRFYQADRDAVTDAVLAAFGRDPSLQRRGILVATQVIETGVDLSADVLLTELAPANALVQRWGRCARWGGDGQVIVAPPPRAPVYPYVGEREAALVERTRSWLRTHAGSPLMTDPASEDALVNDVHGEDDADWLAHLERALIDRTGAIGCALHEGDYALAGELIRHVEQRTVLVHGQPDRLAEPLRCQGFSLATGTLLGLARAARSTTSGDSISGADDDEATLDPPPDLPWRLKVPVWGADEGPERQQDTPSAWRPVDDPRALLAAPVVAVHPALVQYDPGVGLEPRPGPVAAAEAYWAHPTGARTAPFTRFAYRRETLAEHVERMIAVLEQSPVLWPQLAPVASSYESWLGWPPGLLRQVVDAAIVLHDAGKLSPSWQAVIREVHRRQGRPAPPWLVHSDSDANATLSPLRFPPHALSGAAHALEVALRFDEAVAATGQMPGETAASPGRVLFTAIATHHAPNARDRLLRADAVLDEPARAEVRRLLTRSCLPAEVPTFAGGEQLLGCDVPLAALGQEAVAREAVALALVTRLLRLAAGWSQEREAG